MTARSSACTTWIRAHDYDGARWQEVPMVPIQASGTYTERDLRQVPMSPKPARGQSEQI